MITEAHTGVPPEDASSSVAVPEKVLPEPARRALEEAAARRREIEAAVAAMPPEKGGRGGEEPVRYGDWEVKGLATDF
jgi:hypothetical protein